MRVCVSHLFLAVMVATALYARGDFLPDFSAPLRQLDIVRQALRDELWSLANRHAEKAEKEKETQHHARLMQLEAMAGEERYTAMLAKLDEWNDPGEIFRYWRAWVEAQLGNTATAQSFLAEPFKDAGVALLAARLKARLAVKDGNRAVAEACFRQVDKWTVTNAPVRIENALEWTHYVLAEDTTNSVQAALEILRAAYANVPAAELGANGGQARFEYAGLLSRTGAREEANKIYRALVDAGTNTSENVFVSSALALSFAEKDTARARVYASNAVMRATRSELRCQAGFRLGLLELETNDHTLRNQGAVRIRALVRESPEAPEARTAQLSLADALLAANEAAAAEAEYRIYLEAWPQEGVSGNIHALEGRAWALVKLGRRTEAGGVFARAAQVAVTPEDRDRCLFKQADVLVADARYAEAAQLYEKVVTAGGTLATRASFARADALERAGRFTEASDAFATLARAAGTQSVEAALRLAAYQTGNGQLEAAIKTCTLLLAKKELANEIRARALRARGRAYYQAAQWQKAESDFKAAIQFSPAQQGELRFLGALCKSAEGREAEAYEDVKRLAKDQITATLRTDITFWLACHEARQGHWQQAENGFVQYAQMSTNHPLRRAEALVRAARASGARSDYARTVALISQASTVAPKAPFMEEALIVQGEALITLARYEDAVLVLDRILRQSPTAAHARRAGELKADALYQLGAGDAKRYEEALVAYQALDKSSAESEWGPSERITLAFKTARTLEKLRRFAEADDYYYEKVIGAYETLRRQGVWINDAASADFVRAAFALVERLEAADKIRPALRVLKIVEAAHVPASTEAARRIAEIKSKGSVW